MKFFVGLHQPADAAKLPDVPCMISIHRLERRRSDFKVGPWILDSGAFTTIAQHGAYPASPAQYAEQINRWTHCGELLAAVSQDYMCEPWILERCHATVAEHQGLTILRYLELRSRVPARIYVMPVIQGYAPAEYAHHVQAYGTLLAPNAWVGVGSVCKRNGNPIAILQVLNAIREVREDLRLHAFGVKKSALQYAAVLDSLYSCDSMAWSYAARRDGQGRQNDWHQAARFVQSIAHAPAQLQLPL